MLVKAFIYLNKFIYQIQKKLSSINNYRFISIEYKKYLKENDNKNNCIFDMSTYY
jgi:dolichyl-phosphate-mannose--protein O-mannosyl transferase